MADLSVMTLDELRSGFVDLGNQLSVIAESRREYWDEISKRITSANATLNAASLSQNERDALLVVLTGGDPMQPTPAVIVVSPMKPVQSP